MHRRWHGLPQINVRVPHDQFRAVKMEALNRGVPVSSILKELVSEWYRVVSARPSPQPEPVYALPRKLPNQPVSLTEMLQQGGLQSGTRANAGTISPRRQGMSDRPQRQGMRDR
jgi:hypothetical protein